MMQRMFKQVSLTRPKPKTQDRRIMTKDVFHTSLFLYSMVMDFEGMEVERHFPEVYLNLNKLNNTMKITSEDKHEEIMPYYDAMTSVVYDEVANKFNTRWHKTYIMQKAGMLCIMLERHAYEMTLIKHQDEIREVNRRMDELKAKLANIPSAKSFYHARKINKQKKPIEAEMKLLESAIENIVRADLAKYEETIKILTPLKLKGGMLDRLLKSSLKTIEETSKKLKI